MLVTLLVSFLTLVSLVNSASETPYDFGLFENETILKQFLKEDLELTTELQKLNSQYQDEFLTRFLENQTFAIKNVGIQLNDTDDKEMFFRTTIPSLPLSNIQSMPII